MSGAQALELFGYLGSFLVLVSMLMTSVVKLRVINLIGSAIFATYAILIRSFPTALLNGCLVGVNLYHLLRIRHATARNYQIQTLGAGEGFADWFVRQYQEDIILFFPDTNPALVKKLGGFAVFYENQAAGILLGERKENSFEVCLDYTPPAFRDCSVGAFLYSQLPHYGIVCLSSTADCPEHEKYLREMGFMQQDSRTYVKRLAERRD